MEWIAQLQGQVVGLDTAPLIYFIRKLGRNPVLIGRLYINKTLTTLFKDF